MAALVRQPDSSQTSTPERYLRRLLKGRPGRAALSAEYLNQLFQRQSGCCAISGIKMTWGHGNGRQNTHVSIDRIDSARGYEVGNIQLVCLVVNLMKRELPMGEFLRWCRTIIRCADANEQRTAA